MRSPYEASRPGKTPYIPRSARFYKSLEPTNPRSRKKRSNPSIFPSPYGNCPSNFPATLNTHHTPSGSPSFSAPLKWPVPTCTRNTLDYSPQYYRESRDNKNLPRSCLSDSQTDDSTPHLVLFGSLIIIICYNLSLKNSSLLR